MLASWGEGAAQISSSQADAVKLLTYPVHPETDKLFAFYQSNSINKPGSLTATGPGAGNFDFVWVKYDETADGFTIPVKSDNNVLSSSITGLGEGGYRVHVTNGADVDTFFLAWVMLDKLLAWTEKNDEGKLESFRSGCSDGNYVIISGGVELDSFIYYDPVSHEQVGYLNDFEIRWTSDNPDLIIPNPTRVSAMAANYSENPPYKDTYYILTATDSLGMTDVDSVLYDTKHTKSEFSVEYYDKVNMDWSADINSEWSKDKGSLDAPLSVRFKNESENGYNFTWVFVDTTDELTGIQTREYEETPDKEYQPEFIYYTADKFYYPYLISISDAGCRDTFSLEDGINVVPAQLLIPNVFTPNGDEINDVFLFKHQSLKECRITISDRFGRVVYRKYIENIYEWEGWRGTIFNTDREVPEGQYYYVVEGMGYDNSEFKDPNYFEQRKIDKQQGGGTSTPDGESKSLNLYTGWIYIFREKGEF